VALVNFIILYSAGLSGGILAFYFRKRISNNYGLVLSFSGSFLFGILLLDLFPEIFKHNLTPGIFMIVGYFLQLILEQLTHGIEHGHIHGGKHKMGFIYGLIIGLSIHSFMDGIPVAEIVSGHIKNNSLLYAISIHKMPEVFALASILIVSNFRKSSIILTVILFAAIAPGAMLLFNSLQLSDSLIFNIVLPIVAGSFLHVTTTILFESESGVHHFNFKKMIAILLGIGLAILINQ